MAGVPMTLGWHGIDQCWKGMKIWIRKRFSKSWKHLEAQGWKIYEMKTKVYLGINLTLVNCLTKNSIVDQKSTLGHMKVFFCIIFILTPFVMKMD